MRTSCLTRWSFLLALGTTAPAPGDAQTIPSPYAHLEERQELGLLGGLMNAGTGRFDFGPNGGQIYGVRYGVELSGPLSFEGVVQHIDGERNVVDPSRDEGDRIIGKAPSNIWTIEARLKVSVVGRRSWHKLSPFLDFGAGVAFDTADPSPLDEVLLPGDVFDFGTSFFGTMSGGTRWYITRRFTLRGDYAFSLWKIDTPPGYADPTRGFDAVSDGEWLSGNTFTLALLIRW